jgi:hypothetical protein
MTDQELKDLVASLAIQSAKTDQELKDLIAQSAKTDAKFDRLEAQMARTDERFAKTALKLDRIGKKIGDIGHSNGDVKIDRSDFFFDRLEKELNDIGFSNGDAAENYFYNSLEDDIRLGNVKFDTMTKNIKLKKHRLEDEYDLFLENGDAVGVIEVKYKVQKSHIESLLEKKAENFRILFPDYKNYKLYIGIAGLSIDTETEQYAIENGLVVLKQKGDIMQVNSQNMKAF